MAAEASPTQSLGLFDPSHQVGVGMPRNDKEAPMSSATRHFREPLLQPLLGMEQCSLASKHPPWDWGG